VAAVFAVEDKSNNQQDLETSEGHLRGFYGGFGGLGYGGYGAYGGGYGLYNNFTSLIDLYFHQIVFLI
jgi:hypothetical protein